MDIAPVMPHMVEPAQLVLQYLIPGDGSGTKEVIVDLARDLSVVNRRLYRQGYTYAVGKVVFAQQIPMTTTALFAQTAGNTWMVQNAWKKGKAIWTGQRKEVAELLPGIDGKWSDFKVKLDDSGLAYLPCIASDTGVMDADDWEFSEVFWDDDGTERSPVFHIIGGTDPTTSVGLVQEYHISRARVNVSSPVVDPDASDSIYAKMLHMQDELSDALIDDIEGDNDQPPYDYDEMPGGDTVADAPWTQEYSFSNPVGGLKGHLSGFAAECGLIKFRAETFVTADGTTAVSSAVSVFIHLMPGPYRGVLAERMGQ